MTLLEVSHLKKSYGGRPILRDLSFEVRQGEVIGLLGPNGAGKTTAFYLTIGLIQPEEGRVIFQGEEVTSYSLDKRARMGMGYLAQEPSIFRGLTVEENILCILETLEPSKAKRKELLEELLSELRLQAHAKKPAVALSGGERRRLEITRALITRPALLLLDEPFANIDPLTVADLKQMISLLKQKGISILITDHNAREIFSIADRSYLICDGVVLISGTSEELLESPLAREAYLGSDFKL